MNSEKRVNFQPQKVSVFMEIGVFFSHKISEKGVLFKLENTDGLHVLHWSGGTGGYGHKIYSSIFSPHP